MFHRLFRNKTSINQVADYEILEVSVEASAACRDYCRSDRRIFRALQSKANASGAWTGAADHFPNMWDYGRLFDAHRPESAGGHHHSVRR